MTMTMTMTNKEEKMAEKGLTAEPKYPYPFGEEVNHYLSKIRSVPDSAKVKEIFLWELIRNATDALRQVRLESMVDKNKFCDPPELFIRIVPDQRNGTLSVIDCGIGMTRDDLATRIGAIFLSTRLIKYRRTIRKYSTPNAYVDLSRIYSNHGMFGLGFYSAFMVADKVVITTKKVGHDYRYVGEFDAIANVASLTVAARDTSGGGDTLPDRGTKVTLHLKEAHREYLNERKLQALVNKYPKVLFRYPVSILVLDEKKNPIEKQIVVRDDYKEGEEEQWERIRKLFVEFIGDKLKNVKVVVSDRVFDMPCNLSVDTSTFEINPRHRAIARIRRAFEADPNDKDLKYAVLNKVQWCIGNFRAYDRRHGTTFYEKAKETFSFREGGIIDFSCSDEESDEESEEESDFDEESEYYEESE